MAASCKAFVIPNPAFRVRDLLLFCSMVENISSLRPG